MDELLHHDAIIRERIIGKSVRAIAQNHGCSIAEVNKALDLFAVATINAKVRTHTLALELSRLDELQSVFYERAKATWRAACCSRRSWNAGRACSA